MQKTTMKEGLSFMDSWNFDKSNFRKIEKDKKKNRKKKRDTNIINNFGWY